MNKKIFLVIFSLFIFFFFTGSVLAVDETQLVRNNLLQTIINLLMKMGKAEIVAPFSDGSNLVNGVTLPSVSKQHPYLVFDDITQTSGWKNKTITPWKSWESSIITAADKYLSYDFSLSSWAGTSYSGYDRTMYRSGFVAELAFAYQLTKNTLNSKATLYAEKAKGGLLNLGLGSVLTDTDKAMALGKYSLAYDWIQPYLDSATDMTIRDKLASYADNCYKDLNKNVTYISFSDYHGQQYPNVAIAAVALADYTNPNNLVLSSTPKDWLKTGTDYLFVNDLLHKKSDGTPIGRSLLSFGFDENSGKHWIGTYKSYVIDDLAWWFQIYSHYFGRNILEDYPAAKKIVMSEVWESLPNGYQNNYCTSGNFKWLNTESFINLLSGDEQAWALKYIDSVKNAVVLPYSSGFNSISTLLRYSTEQNYSTVARKDPNWTNYLNKNSIYQVIRKDWQKDSDWMSLSTDSSRTLFSASNRNAMHDDQLGIEYYSRGDLLLADAGEPKYTSNYGTHENQHNSFAIENPRQPWPNSSWINSPARSIYKGLTYDGMVTPVDVNTTIQTSWVDFINASAHVTKVRRDEIKDAASNYYYINLSSPIETKRSILYNKDYFTILDQTNGSESWIYRNVFRPTSLKTVATKDVNADHSYSISEIGNVNLSLSIGGTAYNWLGLPHKVETNTGISTNSIRWETTNPYGNIVKAQLFTAPASDVLITKDIGRIGGYAASSEVYSPIIYFRTPSQKDMYRVTVLLSRYATEEEKIATVVPVTGTGNAIKVTSSLFTDYVYNGMGVSVFDELTTDANNLYLRKNNEIQSYTLVNGSYIKNGNNDLVRLSATTEYFTFKKEGEKRTLKTKGSGATNINLFDMNSSIVYRVIRDGLVYSNWSISREENKMIITNDSSEHDFIIEPMTTDVVSPTISNIITNNITSTSANISWNTNELSDGLVKYGTATNNYTINQSNSNYLTAHSISLNGLTSSTKYYYQVVSKDSSANIAQSSEYSFTTLGGVNTAPVLGAIGNKTVVKDSLLTFTVNATDADSNNLTYSISTLPTGATFVNKVFSWTPANIGSYPITITVNDGSGGIDTETITITVNPAIIIDTIAPSSIIDLTGSNITSNSITLNWKAPGDDNNVGTATSYDIRYSTLPITSDNWTSITQVVDKPTPLISGTSQSLTVSSLIPGTTYYFAIKSIDESNNTSLISNILTVQTLSQQTTCSSFTYSDWSACQSNGTQTRTVISSSPTGCVLGNPIVSQSCTYSQPSPDEYPIKIGNITITKPLGDMTREELIDLINSILNQPKSYDACLGVTFTRNLYLESYGKDVQCLQAILNSDKDTQVKDTGWGSPNNESYYFGTATQSALIKFQFKYNIITTETSPEAGFVGTVTQAKLNSWLGR